MTDRALNLDFTSDGVAGCIVMEWMPIINSWAAWMRGGGMSERTIVHRLQVVAQFAAHTRTDPTAATWTDIAGWLGSNPAWSPGTRHNYYRGLQAWHRWLLLQGVRDDDPMTRLKPPRAPKYRPRPVAQGALAPLLAVANRRRTRAMILLAAYQGLRVHEIAKIRGADFNGPALTVDGKGGTTAVIPVHEMVAEIVTAYPDGYWFPSYEFPARPVSSRNVSAVIGDAMRRAGIPGTAHQLRHWYATEMLRAGADLRTVQENMRHGSITSTAIYTAVDDTRRRAAVDSLRRPALPPAA